ncbi:MAG: alkaline phosphatase family protein [Candidatus Obscuribacterales bacterium]|nr:alkaline phosphatase family protein [Candidatus Obscuribacterales bacterium]
MNIKLVHLLSRRTTALVAMFLVVATATSSGLPAFAAEKDTKIKLVLQITIDQLRGDQPLIFRERFGEGGFKLLFDRGAYYANAHYCHADTETAPGHATLATGTVPARHGITNSEWYDYEKGRIVYSVEDQNSPLVDQNSVSTAGTTSSEKGRSPAHLLSTTIGDEIVLASFGKARSIAVSGKDRGAILPGGHCGKAFWLSNGKFVNSKYYNDALPVWVEEWNQKKVADTYRDKAWTLLRDKQSYLRKDIDDRSFEGYYKHLGRTLPKPLACKNDEDYYEALLHTPVNDELVLSFAEHAIARLGLGLGEGTDYLSVSFSSTDYVGHGWGIGSLEAEDNLLRVDRNLAELFSFIDRKVGLDKVLIVLSADHGVAEIAESMKGLSIDAQRIPSKEFRAYVNARLKERFSTEHDLIKTFIYPYIYLDRKFIADGGIGAGIDVVQDAAAEYAMQYQGVAYAVGRSRIARGELPANTGYYARIVANFHPERSGDVHVVPKQFVMFGKVKTNQPGEHGSVWSYDTYVPVAFFNVGVKPGFYRRSIGPQDIAPTIAALLGIKSTSASSGEVLKEIAE